MDLSGRRSTTWLDGATTLKLVQYYSDLGSAAFWAAADGHIHFEHGDMVGSERKRTGYNASQESYFDSMPFGESVVQNGSDLSPSHFAQLDQDFGVGSGVAHAMGREYLIGQGRFSSPDPYQGSYDPSNPQSFNRYNYALNHPLSFLDPSGFVEICEDESDSCEEGGGGDGGWDGSQDGTNTQQDPTGSGSYDDPYHFQGAGGSTNACTYCGAGEGAPTITALDPGPAATSQSVSYGLAPKDEVPQNPCAHAGNAQDPSYYINRARSSQINPIQLAQDLANFRRKNSLDAQPFGASPAYGNYVYGVYLRTAGLPLSVALAGVNWYAGGGAGDGKAQYSGPLDPNYSNIPPANVANIINGYNAVRNGTVCHVQ